MNMVRIPSWVNPVTIWKALPTSGKIFVGAVAGLAGVAASFKAADKIAELYEERKARRQNQKPVRKDPDAELDDAD